MDTLTRERITYEINEDGYVILLDGTPWITQDRTNLPYPDRTLEECCQQQIEDLLTAAAEAAQAQINAEEKLAELYALYATLVKKGTLTIDEVPEASREKVQALVDAEATA